MWKNDLTIDFNGTKFGVNRSMTKKYYNNPPIKEVICEFKFDQTSWDPTIPGIMYERLRRDFPNRESRKEIETEFQINEQNINPNIRLSERAIFTNGEGNIMVQVGKNHLVLNHIQPYTKWDEFISSIETVYKLFLEVAEPNSIERAEQRYINEFKFSEDKIKLEDYFDFYPHFELDLEMSSFITGIQTRHQDDIQKIQLSSAVGPSILLDIQYFTGIPKSINFDQALDWLNNAHNKNIVAFEGCIKQNLRNRFGEV